MATSETARWNADAVTRMVQDARLQTTFSKSDPRVSHTVRNQADPGSLLREYWEFKDCIGCGKFGYIDLEKCVDVDVLHGDSDQEDDVDDGGTINKVGSLRAVKELSKPIGQSELPGEFLRELHSHVFFSQPKVCLPSTPSLSFGNENESGYSHL